MSELELLARETATKYGLDPRLICALCEVESSWMPWAVRHEAGYEWLVGFEPIPLDSARFWVTANYEYRQRDAGDRLWQPQTEKLSKFGGGVISDGVTILTELLGQQTSWGLLQIMGAVARERGFRGWLTELCDPSINLEWGCRHLRWMVDHNNAYGLPDFRIKPEDLAAAWNGGKVRRISCPKCAGSGDKSRQVYVECEYCHGTGKAYTNQSYVDRVVNINER